MQSVNFVLINPDHFLTTGSAVRRRVYPSTDQVTLGHESDPAAG